MPIYRCNQCGFVSEDSQTAVNSQTPCGRCGKPSTVYGTVFFVEELIKRLTQTTRELKLLQQAAHKPSDNTATTASSADGASHALLQQWFASKNIQADFDPAAVDTSGFFDEAAERLGNEYTLFGELISRVSFAYRKEHNSVTLNLSQLAQKDGQTINQFCRKLYQYTFFSRYYYQKPEKIVRLNLQPASAIRQFFEGGWLEWYALVCLLELIEDRSQNDSYARSVKITFPNEDLHELDVMCLPDGKPPFCIECKSGEFRRDIDKYVRLRKRLGIEPERFLICSADLTQEQTNSLSTMYELNFVNLDTLKDHLQRLI